MAHLSTREPSWLCSSSLSLGALSGTGGDPHPTFYRWLVCSFSPIPRLDVGSWGSRLSRVGELLKHVSSRCQLVHSPKLCAANPLPSFPLGWLVGAVYPACSAWALGFSLLPLPLSCLLRLANAPLSPGPQARTSLSAPPGSLPTPRPSPLPLPPLVSLNFIPPPSS